ncbi:hypothetical protein MAMC_01113 [Methylacidimicrobium cyclopophantes]|uniref:Outer membrane protein beta-barrel domain-containing protein n=1 Tax=Methylacidimicrobium cyclopophantes TaxID=1041766 RepID=A0A5E6MBD9_9BACT|nr:hypothetical protein [Methylacidimicrobium cyclopophantes]VVM06518.1 hypothetical protein MAMC_01113 [Methylacidimicrobium cyclopophantes]
MRTEHRFRAVRKGGRFSAFLVAAFLIAGQPDSFGWSGEGGEGVILTQGATARAPQGDQGDSWFVAGFVGPQWNRFPSGFLPSSGEPVHSEEGPTVILSPTGGYYWYDPRRTGHFSFTLELTGAYNTGRISTQIGNRGQANGVNGGFTVIFGTVGYRMGAWEPIVGFGAGAGFLTSESQSESSSVAVVPVLLVDVGMRYHINARWSFRFESFFGWTGSVSYSYPSGDVVAGHMLSNNVVIGLGYALGR